MLNRITQRVEYAGYVKNRRSGEYDLLFVADCPAMIVRKRAMEEACRYIKYGAYSYDLSDVIIEKRTITTKYEELKNSSGDAGMILYRIETYDNCKHCKPYFALREPPLISREWITRAEYELPDGFELGETACGEPAVFKGNEHVLLASDRWRTPILGSLSGFVWPKKIRDISWEEKV